MTFSHKAARLRAGALWGLTLGVAVTVGCHDDGGSKDDGPCEFEEQRLAASDATPWGTLVGEDIAALLGPYSGTWTWALSTEEIEIEDAGQAIAVEATFIVDEASYRVREHVGGGAGVVCFGPTILVDGVLSVRDQNGGIVISVPVTAQRTLGETPHYYVFDLISPVSAFSSQLTELSGFAGTSIRVLANWSVEGESLAATFEYVGQDLDDSGGFGFIIDVAEFK